MSKTDPLHRIFVNKWRLKSSRLNILSGHITATSHEFLAPQKGSNLEIPGYFEGNPGEGERSSSWWWFQFFILCSPLLGEMIQIDEHIFQCFQLGWFNHQVVMFFTVCCWWIFSRHVVARDWCSSTWSPCKLWEKSGDDSWTLIVGKLAKGWLGRSWRIIPGLVSS